MKTLTEQLSKINIHTEKLAIARAILAFGTLATILANDLSLLTHTAYVHDDDTARNAAGHLFAYRFSLFNLFSLSVAKALAVAILVGVISGYLPQFMCLLHAWVNISITNTFIPIDGGDQIAANLSLLLIPLCLTDRRMNQWSAARNPGNPAVNVFAGISLFFIQIQAAIIYLHAGIGKLFTAEWKDGTAIFYWVSHPVHGAPDSLRDILELITLSKWVPYLTWLIMIFEILLFACIFANKRTKAGFLVAGILFHLFIVFIHGLFSFFFSMFALLLLYLDDANNSVRVFHYGKHRLLHYFKDRLSARQKDLGEVPVARTKV
jgi:antimicrobial peptide system SdpB family protein